MEMPCILTVEIDGQEYDGANPRKSSGGYPPAPGAPLPGFATGSGCEPVPVWDHAKDRVADYLAEYGRPEQITAWRDGRPYVAELAENSAGF